MKNEKVYKIATLVLIALIVALLCVDIYIDMRQQAGETVCETYTNPDGGVRIECHPAGMVKISTQVFSPENQQ